MLKEKYGEENVKEISISGSIHEVFLRIRTQIDPFFIKYDEDALVRTSADINEAGGEILPIGEYGPFCPVSYV